MKELFSLISRLILLITALVLWGTGVVSFFKGDPAHIWIAYFAGAVAWVTVAEWVKED